MTLVIAFFVLLTAGILAFVFSPFFGAGTEAEAGAERTRLEREKLAALQLLRDLEFDLETGKLTADDYAAARAEAEAHAIGILRAMDRIGAAEGWSQPLLESEIERVRRRLAGGDRA